MTNLLVAQRTLFTVILLVATGYLALQAASLRVDPGVESLMPAGGGDLQRLREFNRVFGPDEIVVMALHGDPLFTAEHLGRMAALTEELGRLPHVVRVLSPTNARDIDGDEFGPLPRVPYEEVRRGELAPAALGRLLAGHPLYGGLLVARDAGTAALLVHVERVEGDDGYRREIVRRVRALAAAPGPGLTARVAGMPLEKVDIAAFIARDQRLVVPLVLVVMALVTGLLYRHPVGVAVPLGVMLCALVWTMGIYTLAGRMLNPVTSLLSPVVMVVSVAGAIHYLNRFRAAEAAGRGWREALALAHDRVKVPCFNAALTTAVGFAALMLMPIPAIREFGLFTAVGVMVAFGLTMLLVPLLLAWLPGLPPGPTGPAAARPVEHALERLVAGIQGHPLRVALAALLVIVLAAAGIARLRLETHMIRSLRSGSALYQATMYIDEHLTGVNSLEMLVPVADHLDPDFLRRVQAFERAVAGLPGVRKVTGLPDLYGRVNRAFHQGRDEFETIPDGPEARQDLLDADHVLRENAPEARQRFLSTAAGLLCVEARVTGMNTARARELFAGIRSAAATAGLDGVQLTGSFVVLTNMSTFLVRNQVRGLAGALGVILILMAIQFRSLRLGLLGAVPSVVPVVMVYGLMGWLEIPLSVPTAMIASIAIGMTVDNTIHLTARYLQERELGHEGPLALREMMVRSGPAVVHSTLIVSLGFCAGVVGSFLPTVHFAILTGTALVLGLLCVLVLLPLLLMSAGPRHGRGAAAALLLLGLAGPPVVAPAAVLTDGDGSAVAGGDEHSGPVLHDQFGAGAGPGLHRGRPLLVLHGGPSSLRRMKAWEDRVGERSEPAAVLRVMDLRELRGKKPEDEVRQRLLDSVPAEIAIAMDWEGEVAALYGLPGDAISATVVDAAGRACLTVAGPAQEEGVRKVADLLAALGADGSCPG